MVGLVADYRLARLAVGAADEDRAPADGLAARMFFAESSHRMHADASVTPAAAIAAAPALAGRWPRCAICGCAPSLAFAEGAVAGRLSTRFSSLSSVVARLLASDLSRADATEADEER